MTSPITQIGESPAISDADRILAEAIVTARAAHVAAQQAFVAVGGSTSIGTDGLTFQFPNGAQGVAAL